MKTTLVLPDSLVVALKRRAAERGASLSALAAEFIRRGLDEKSRTAHEPDFPVFDGRQPLLDLSDWNAVQEALDDERDARLYVWMRPSAEESEEPPPDR